MLASVLALPSAMVLGEAQRCLRAGASNQLQFKRWRGIVYIPCGGVSILFQEMLHEHAAGRASERADRTTGQAKNGGEKRERCPHFEMIQMMTLPRRWKSFQHYCAHDVQAIESNRVERSSMPTLTFCHFLAKQRTPPSYRLRTSRLFSQRPVTLLVRLVAQGMTIVLRNSPPAN